MKHRDVNTWPTKKGKTVLLKHLSGKQLTPSQAITAKCYECTGAFDAGEDCRVPDCPLYQFLPHGKWGQRKKRQISPEQRSQMAARIRTAQSVKPRSHAKGV